MSTCDMIIDVMENAGLYSKGDPRLAKAFGFLAGKDLSAFKKGRYEIEGSSIYALVSFSEGFGRDKARLEAHRKYIDVQLCLKGDDVIGWKPKKECRVVAEKYNAEKDIEFFADIPVSWLTLKPGFFAVFFPQEAHAPLAGEGPLHKVVVKVAV